MSDLKLIACLESDTIAPDYSNLVDKYYKTSRGSRPTELFLKDVKNNYGRYIEEDPGVFVHCYDSFNVAWVDKRIFLKDGVVYYQYVNEQRTKGYGSNETRSLYVKTESGKEFSFGDYHRG